MPSELLWTPSKARINAANITSFKDKYQPQAANYQELWQWSVDHPAEFWQSVWKFGAIIGNTGPTAYAPHADIKKARFFPQAKLNYAENMLRNPNNSTAIIFTGEDGRMRAMGVVAGDRIAGFVPNMAESIAAMLATASIGAIWSSCSPDFGANGVEDRFGQIKPKVLFAASGYFYGGKTIDSTDTLKEIASRLPSLEKLVVWDYAINEPDLSAIPNAVSLTGFTSRFSEAEIEFTQMPFDAPLYILFSSGTTGKPKCIVHSAGGVTIQHIKEHMLHADVKKNSKLFYFTTCGWMMWNWLVSGLMVEATLYLFDGNPMHPSQSRLLDLAEAEGIEIFGTSAKFIDACAKANLRPVKTHNLPALQTVLSTGSPLAPDNFNYIYENWKSDILLGSISGGTDICGCFMGAVPTQPIHKGAIQCRNLGMDVQVYDDEGNIARDEPGELVCCKPHPTMPIGFWDDEDGTKYHAAYFDVFENIWRHGQDWDNDVRVILFVRLSDGINLDEALIKKIKAQIRTGATPRHTPAKVIAVNDIPRTKSGKITELAVRDVVHGRTVKNQTALANPEALELFKDLTELST